MKVTADQTTKESTKGQTVRIGVLNDIHYDPFYDPKAGVEDFCRSNDPFNTKRVITWLLESKSSKDVEEA